MSSGEMKILMTGGTGFIGRALIDRLKGEHEVTALVRDVETANLDVSVLPMDAPAQEHDALVNLAGEPVLGRWTDSKKERLRKSRVDLTRRMVETHRPKVLVSASAVGYYGDRGDETLEEDAAPGGDFLARLCQDWEAAASSAEGRVVTIRTGVVLGRGGGALQKMLTPFKLGAGGRIGSGKQYMPWIHLADLVELYTAAATDHRYQGALNGSAPEPVTNEKFTKTLGRVLKRPTLLPIPAPALEVMFGEAASILTGGQRAVPAKARSLGFEFRFHDLEAALRDLV